MLSLYLTMLDDPDDTGKFEKIYNEYHDIMFAVAFKLTENINEAETALSDAFVAIARNIKNIDTSSERMLAAYLCKVVKAKVINTLSDRDKILDTLPDDEIDAIPDPTPNIGELLPQDESVSDSLRFIEQLPEMMRIVVTLRLCHGRKLSQIARDIGEKASTVRSWYKRGMDRLNSMMADDERSTV